jgi:hypothetical protein
MFDPRRGNIWLLLLVYLMLAGIYGVVNPLFEAPDEVWHYEYIRWLVEGRGLPEPADVGSAPWAQEGSQPPLYYLLGAALTTAIPTGNATAVIRYNPHAAVGEAGAIGNKNMVVHGAGDGWPWQGVVLAGHWVRAFSSMLGALTVYGVYRTARLLFPHQPAMPFVATSLVAFNPQFLFLSAAINNDNLVTVCCVSGLWQLVQLIEDAGSAEPERYGWHWIRVALVGVLAGAAALSKLSGLAFAPFVALALVWVAWRLRSPGWFVRAGLLSGGLAILVAGWWYVRNWRLYGDPLGLAAMFAVLPGREAPLAVGDALDQVEGIWRSFWAVFGWFNVLAPPWLYWAYALLCLSGVLGLVVGLVGAPPCGRPRGGAPTDGRRRMQLALLILWSGALALLVLRWSQISYAQGRLLFPAIGGLAILLAWGLTRWVPRSRHSLFASGLALLLVLPAGAAPWLWIAPAYAPPAWLPAEQATAIPNPAAVDFGDQVRLRGFAFAATGSAPGAQVAFDLYWEALASLEEDYSIFLHLTDDNGILQAQRDSFPAGGSRATSTWPRHVIVPDRHVVTLPAVLPAPTRLRVDVGVYDFDTGQRLSVAGEDHWTLGHIDIPPQTAPAEVFINFGDQIALTGYRFERWRLRPGEAFVLDLTWQAMARPRADYVVFVHLLLPPDAVWAQRDAMPQAGERPTSAWMSGETIADRLVLDLPLQMPAGLYRVEIGLYHPDTGERLPVEFDDAGVMLGHVRVVE